MNPKTIYLSGPRNQIPENSYHQFAEAAEKIIALGYNVINPHVICQDIQRHLFLTDKAYQEHCMRLCIAEMSGFADTVVTLKDWEFNKEANIEVNVARDLRFISVEHIISFLANHKNAVRATASHKG